MGEGYGAEAVVDVARIALLMAACTVLAQWSCVQSCSSHEISVLEEFRMCSKSTGLQLQVGCNK
jgi:hypothetical protein